jgi:hypothetical protein
MVQVDLSLRFICEVLQSDLCFRVWDIGILSSAVCPVGMQSSKGINCIGFVRSHARTHTVRQPTNLVQRQKSAPPRSKDAQPHLKYEELKTRILVF